VYNAVSEEHVSNNIHTLIDFKALKLSRPHIEVEVVKIDTKEVNVRLTSDIIAPFVLIQMASTHATFKGRWSDNGFWLFPNQSKTLKFSLLEDFDEQSLTLMQLKEAIKVLSLRDSY
jgi:hypothetical protein